MPAQIDLHLHAEAPPRPAKKKWEEQNEEARITFHKTIDGHYRHGKTGYARVACLFLTWLDDDIQCKETEVDNLREIFAEGFLFETDHFEIPSERWQTALQRKVADFIHEYDSPDCMVIIYYGGHGYIGEETGQLKLSAKWAADGDGDPKVFFNDILYCLRLPACDQLLIVDCCSAAKAFLPQPVGKRKFELLTSAGVHDLVPAPAMQGSFTTYLNKALTRLLKSDPGGFSTSRLYRELFHAFPPNLENRPHPNLFDQARQDFGKIWLRRQEVPYAPTAPSKDEKSVHLKLSLQLNKQPDNVLMNELAIALQYLPHVNKVEFKDLWAPRQQIENFTQSIVQAQKLRPLIRKIVAKRRLKGLKEMNQASMVTQSPSIQRMLLEQKHHSLYDWSNWSSDVKHDGWGSRPNGHHRHKSLTWPVTKQGHTVSTKSFYNRLFSIDLAVDLPGKSLVSRLCSRWGNTDASSTHTSNSTTGQGVFLPIPTTDPTALDPTVAALSPSDRHTPRGHPHGEETRYQLMFIATLMFIELVCFCFVMRD